MLVGSLRFPLSCFALLFLGVTSQGLTFTRTVGGRLFGAVVLIGACLCGGLMGFSVLSLSWLASGKKQGLLELLPAGKKLETDILSLYGTANFTDELIHTLEVAVEDIVRFDTVKVSSAFWILIMILFLILLVPWAWARSMKEGISSVFGMINTIQMGVLSTLGLLLPLLGQDELFASGYGSLLKAQLLVCVGMICSGVLVYVRSSHDDYRRGIGNVMLDASKTLSHSLSFMRVARTEIPASQDKAKLAKLERQERDRGAFKPFSELLKDIMGLKEVYTTCNFEPPLPGICSQWWTDASRYAAVADRMRFILTEVGGIEFLALNFYHHVHKLRQEDQERIFSIIESSALKIMSVMVEASQVLTCMPVLKPCSGNSLSWRPKPISFWAKERSMIDGYLSDSKEFLIMSAKSGIQDVLERDIDPADFVFRPKGSSLVILSAIESMIQNICYIEKEMALALDITDYEGVEEPKQKKSPCIKPFIVLFVLGSGLASFKVYFESIKDIGAAILAKMSGKGSNDPVEDGRYIQWKVIYGLKFYFGVSLSLIGILLIPWLTYRDSGSIESALYYSKWFDKWQPVNFIIAVTVCLWPEAETTIMKAFFRALLIAVGGALGYAIMLNGTLSQNPYYVLFITMLVNFCISLFSKYGKSVRFILLLLIYTLFSVVFCQYTGKCCKAGTTWQFAGRTISTMLGATLTFVLGVLLLPLYLSNVLAHFENLLLKASVHLGGRLYEVSPKVFNSQTDPNSDKVTAQSEEFKALLEEIDQSTGKRWEILQHIMEESREKALDDHHLLWLSITLVPMPPVVSMVLDKLLDTGYLLRLCISALKSSFFIDTPAQIYQEFIQSNLQHATGELNAIATDMHSCVSRILESSSRIEGEQIAVDLRNHLQKMEMKRREMLRIFLDLDLDSITWNEADLRFMAWYLSYISLVRKLESLAYQLCMDAPMLDRNQYWAWITSDWLAHRYHHKKQTLHTDSSEPTI